MTKGNICIIGGYDELSKSLFEDLLKNKKQAIFLNFNKSNLKKNKNIFNLEIYELKKILHILRSQNISEIIFLGKIERPNLKDFKLDGEIDKYLPILQSAYQKGDDFLLKSILKIFKQYGYLIKSPLDLSSSCLLSKENLRKANLKFDPDHRIKMDIKKGRDILNALSKFDNAQSIVIVDGYILAIEAAEGTDQMLKRVIEIRKKNKTINENKGVLVKMAKKNQSRLVDLPVLGPKTVQFVAKANLASIAFDPCSTLILNKSIFLNKVKRENIGLFLG
tara:strand:+ start:242 stop:1075 length:834 start_codon:yes stop_codon:yes gene_type:complete